MSFADSPPGHIDQLNTRSGKPQVLCGGIADIRYPLDASRGPSMIDAEPAGTQALKSEAL